MVLSRPTSNSQEGASWLLFWFGKVCFRVKRTALGLALGLDQILGLSQLSVRQKLGNKSERIAAWFLKKKGLRIIGRNILVPGVGELDLLAREGDILVVVEVRSRKTTQAQIPLDSVGQDKRDRILKSTSWLIRRFGLQGVTVRQDIVAVVWPDGKKTPEILHIRDAFRPA